MGEDANIGAASREFGCGTGKKLLKVNNVFAAGPGSKHPPLARVAQCVI